MTDDTPDHSILRNVKNLLGVSADYTVFDLQIIIHINSVFSTIKQLGIGATTFMIEDDSAVWEDFFQDNDDLNSIKTYIYLRVRLLFDPPPTSYQIDALNALIKELEWRLNVDREDKEWTPAS